MKNKSSPSKLISCLLLLNFVFELAFVLNFLEGVGDGGGLLAIF